MRNNYEIQNELKMLIKDATSTTNLIKKNFTQHLAVHNQVLDVVAFWLVLAELSITDDQPYDDDMVDDVADLYPEVLGAKADWAEDTKELL
jgi:DNA-binding ferritin-like protein (Dps family)